MQSHWITSGDGYLHFLILDHWIREGISEVKAFHFLSILGSFTNQSPTQLCKPETAFHVLGIRMGVDVDMVCAMMLYVEIDGAL